VFPISRGEKVYFCFFGVSGNGMDKGDAASAMNFSQNVFPISKGGKGYFFGVFSGNGIDTQAMGLTNIM